MVRNHMHAPVARRQCESCHDAPVAGKPLTTKASGAALCRSCHAEQVAAMMGKAQVHWAIASEDACLSCHDPHAGKERGLLLPVAHPPFAERACDTCHTDAAVAGGAR